MIEPRVFKGARDFLPQEMIHRDRIIGIMKTTFERYGFEPLETPAMEYWEILTGKYGAEGEKLIYRLDYKGGYEVALRYDLTVPLSRVMAMYPQLPRPFKRYQIQPVWRADKPQQRQGRFREFYQCDADTVGSRSMLVDAEIIALSQDILTNLGFKTHCIRINHRQILAGIVAYSCGDESRSADVCRCMDKLEKIGMDGVKSELNSCEIPEASVQRLLGILEISGDIETVLTEMEKQLRDSETALRGIEEMRELMGYLRGYDLPTQCFTFDLHLARGLDYYTGPIFETVLPDQPHIGSLTGGGRYDGLIGRFSGTDVPATGTTIGLDRIFTAMQQLGMLDCVKTRSQVLVTIFNEENLPHSLRVVGELRKQGINAELSLEKEGLKKQFTYAQRKGIPLVVVLGPDELAKSEVSVKDMDSGRQVAVALDELAGYVKNHIKTCLPPSPSL